MKALLFWLISLFTLIFWAYAGLDMFLTLTGNEIYLKDFPPQMVAWVQGFPLWRKALWGLTIALGTAGGVLLILQRKLAPMLLWLASLLMLLAFVGHDIMLAEGIKYYGQTGVIASSVMVALTFLLAWHASAAAKGRRFKR